MASTDDVPLRFSGSGYKPVGESDFEVYLRKEAEGGKIEDNESAPLKRPVNLYDDPPGRQDGTNLNARWGEGSTKEPFHQNNNTYEQSKKERKDITERSFAHTHATEQQDQAAMSALFDHVRSGNFATRSIPLLGKSKLASAPTLGARVKKLLDRF